MKKYNVYQQCPSSVTTYTPECHPEWFMIVPRQGDTVLHPECGLINVGRMTQDSWHRSVSPEPAIYLLGVPQLRDRVPTHAAISVNTAMFACRLFFSQDVLPCSKVNSANENTVLNCHGCPLPLAKNDKLLAQKLSLISSCCCEENPAQCQGKHTGLALRQGMENARIYL